MTSTSSISQIRKFQFFDEIKENISLSEENNNKIIEKKDYEEDNPYLKKLNINI